MDAGLLIVLATLLLAAFTIYRDVRKGRAAKKALQRRLQRASKAMDAFAKAHQFETGAPSAEMTTEVSFGAASAEQELVASGLLLGHEAHFRVHAVGRPELRVLVRDPEIPVGVSLDPAPRGRAQEDYYLGMAEPSSGRWSSRNARMAKGCRSHSVKLALRGRFLPRLGRELGVSTLGAQIAF